MGTSVYVYVFIFYTYKRYVNAYVFTCTTRCHLYVVQNLTYEVRSQASSWSSDGSYW